MTVEVYGLFAHLVHQEPLNRIDGARKKQSMVPDLKLEVFNRIENRLESHLAEMKSISCGDSRYDRDHWSDRRAVDTRATQLQAEYVRKARMTDRAAGVAEGVIGPVEQRLGQFPPIMGLVFGAFFEASERVHDLVETLAQSRVQTQGLREGREGSGQELAQVTGQIRRVLSTAIVRANGNCLLARMCHVGEGADLAGRRRGWAAAEEERMRREREGWWLSVKRGKNLVRRGHFFVN